MMGEPRELKARGAFSGLLMRAWFFNVMGNSGWILEGKDYPRWWWELPEEGGES
jgi:hypothetical protein